MRKWKYSKHLIIILLGILGVLLYMHADTVASIMFPVPDELLRNYGTLSGAVLMEEWVRKTYVATINIRVFALLYIVVIFVMALTHANGAAYRSTAQRTIRRIMVVAVAIVIAASGLLTSYYLHSHSAIDEDDYERLLDLQQRMKEENDRIIKDVLSKEL